jgi:hypothetical protein
MYLMQNRYGRIWKVSVYTAQVLHYFGLNYWANNTYVGET